MSVCVCVYVRGWSAVRVKGKGEKERDGGKERLHMQCVCVYLNKVDILWRMRG